jgi:NAD(P)-dependent dehydrogenase (short-subunit alcohol dehydrogenase family)
MSDLLTGRTAFVTGGARGIGRAVVERFAEEGARVMVGDVAGDDVEALAVGLRERGLDVRATTLDVTDPSSVEAAADACERAFGAADVLVANAGILLLEPVLDMPLEHWRRVLDVNLTGAFLCCRTFGQRMLAAGGGGRILVTSSLFGTRGGRDNGAYSASKFGVIGLVESLAAELAPHDILVNAVCPGQVNTEMMQQLFRDLAESRRTGAHDIERELLAKIPLGRMAAPAEVADVFVFLASPLARYVTGQSVIVDGGSTVA